jgi:hypothetical protein
MHCGYLLLSACPEVRVVILVWKYTVWVVSRVLAGKMCRVAKAKDRRDVLSAFTLLLAPFCSTVLKPDLELYKYNI